ncbi:uncharacterized protein LOC123273311 isoform X2 [Cotesia glomerata]|uniref:uncharacterized protein LOC123273311 isoform X2 n=1 Tax=Cotesia glomerata TaxID=32391 RepID=UPI001D02505B|nr:uncharacterized protein LOC123273311 isoform X2 [Cotesia glomerata]
MRVQFYRVGPFYHGFCVCLFDSRPTHKLVTVLCPFIMDFVCVYWTLGLIVVKTNCQEFLLAIDVTSSGTPEEKLKWAFRMYDVDGNGVIDIQEMTKIVQAIYDMLGACSSNRPADSAEERAKNIFAKMDENNDGQLTQDEFLKGCLQDEELSKMLAP